MGNTSDYITIERIWQDACYFQVRVECKSECILASCEVYTSNEDIEELQDKIEKFLAKKPDEAYFWTSGETGDTSTPCVSFEFKYKDKLGHVQVEVYMELDDGGALSKHNCCFYINTEIGQLDQFKKELLNLRKPIIGIKAMLNQTL